jgi:hypothetical protein
MPAWLLVTLIFLATHRLTRLAIHDAIPLVKIPRDRAIEWLDPTPEQIQRNPAAKGHWGNTGRALAYLLECPWCMSVYVAAAVVVVTDLAASVPVPWLVWIAASSVTGLMADYSARVDQQHELAEIEKRRATLAERRETGQR